MRCTRNTFFVCLLMLAAFLAAVPHEASAQCVDVVQDVAGASSITLDDAQELGQSFVAPCDAFLIALTLDVRIFSAEAATGDVQIYDGDGTAGALLASEPYSFSTADPLTVTFSTPPAVTEGSVYTFFLNVTGGRGGLVFGEGDPYPDGTGYVGGEPASVRPLTGNRDFVFTAVFDEDATVSAEAVETGPASYVLSRAYPNPFAAQATVTLAVAQRQRVELAVYDLLGRRVAVLFDGVLAGGVAQPFVFAAAGLPRGVYAVRATGETFVASQAVTLVR